MYRWNPYEKLGTDVRVTCGMSSDEEDEEERRRRHNNNDDGTGCLSLSPSSLSATITTQCSHHDHEQWNHQEDPMGFQVWPPHAVRLNMTHSSGGGGGGGTSSTCESPSSSTLAAEDHHSQLQHQLSPKHLLLPQHEVVMQLPTQAMITSSGGGGGGGLAMPGVAFAVCESNNSFVSANDGCSFVGSFSNYGNHTGTGSIAPSCYQHQHQQQPGEENQAGSSASFLHTSTYYSPASRGAKEEEGGGDVMKGGCQQRQQQTWSNSEISTANQIRTPSSSSLSSLRILPTSSADLNDDSNTNTNSSQNYQQNYQQHRSKIPSSVSAGVVGPLAPFTLATPLLVQPTQPPPVHQPQKQRKSASCYPTTTTSAAIGSPDSCTLMIGASTNTPRSSTSSTISPSTNLLGAKSIAGGMQSTIPASPPALAAEQALSSVNDLGIRWVCYIRSCEQDKVIEQLVRQADVQTQHLMLETIFSDFLQGKSGASTTSPFPPASSLLMVGATNIGASLTPGVHQTTEGRHTFFSLCTRDRGNVLLYLLEEWKERMATASSGSGATHPSPTSRNYLEVCAAALEHHWQELTVSQLGGIGLIRLFQALPVLPFQDRLARLTLQTATTLALHQFGNFIVSEILKTAAQHPEQFGFVFDQLAAQWSQPQVFAQLAESRFGSHALESFLKFAPASSIVAMCRPLLLTSGGVEMCIRASSHPRANYPMQAVLKALSREWELYGCSLTVCPAAMTSATTPPCSNPHFQQPQVDCAVCSCTPCCTMTAPQLSALFQHARVSLLSAISSTSQYSQNIRRILRHHATHHHQSQQGGQSQSQQGGQGTTQKHNKSGTSGPGHNSTSTIHTQ